MQNEHRIDRTIRFFLGAALILFAVITGHAWAWLGVIPLATAVVGWCPLYRLVGINTCRTPTRRTA